MSKCQYLKFNFAGKKTKEEKNDGRGRFQFLIIARNRNMKR